MKKRTLVLALGVSVGALVAVASTGRTGRTRRPLLKGLIDSNLLNTHKFESPSDSEVYYI